MDNRAVDVVSLRAALKEAITGEVRFERLDRALYSTDASIYQIVPLGVVIPKSADDVVATVKECARFGVPITARGGGTSGGARWSSPSPCRPSPAFFSGWPTAPVRKPPTKACGGFSTA